MEFEQFCQVIAAICSSCCLFKEAFTEKVD